MSLESGGSKYSSESSQHRKSGTLRHAMMLTILALAPCLHGCMTRRETEEQHVLLLATTTSVRDSGLLDALLPRFETTHHCRVDTIAVGSGAALRLGAAGEVDALIVHAPQAESEFMRQGHGQRRETFMENDFVLLGPPDDPAQVAEVDIVEAFRRIAATQSPFISRGDDSGTHKRERQIWLQAAVEPTQIGRWSGYVESGQGMGPTLTMADELSCYVLSDMGTFLRFRRKLDLIAFPCSGKTVRNPYSAIVIDPERHLGVNFEFANRLVDYLLSPQVQEQIRQYTIDGQPLFRPTRLPNRDLTTE